MPALRAGVNMGSGIGGPLPKRETAPAGRKHGLRARLALSDRSKTVLTFESGARTYLWSTDRGRARIVVKH